MSSSLPATKPPEGSFEHYQELTDDARERLEKVLHCNRVKKNYREKLQVVEVYLEELRKDTTIVLEEDWTQYHIPRNDYFRH